jgi:hypothetical protein
LSGDEAASSELRDFASRVGVPVSRFSGRYTLMERMVELIGNKGTDGALAELYTWRVLRFITRGNWDDPTKSGFDPARISAIAMILVSDVRIFKSIKRTGSNDLVDFGIGSHYGSRRTIAFLATRVALEKELLVSQVDDQFAGLGQPRSFVGGRRIVPPYRDIERGAGVIRAIGLLFFLFSSIPFAIAILVILRAGSQPPFRQQFPVSPGEETGRALIIGCLVGWGIVLFAIGLLIRLIAAVALAIRDIARNSFEG